MSVPVSPTSEFNMERIESILDILREMGVEEFECPHFHVRFAQTLQIVADAPSATPVTEANLANELRKVAPTPRSQWEHPALWGGGPAPKFPTDPDRK